METKWEFIVAQCLYFNLRKSYEIAKSISELLVKDNNEFWNEHVRAKTIKDLKVFTPDTICKTIYHLAANPDYWCGTNGSCSTECPILKNGECCLTGHSLVDQFLISIQKETFFEDGEW